MQKDEFTNVFDLIIIFKQCYPYYDFNHKIKL